MRRDLHLLTPPPHSQPTGPGCCDEASRCRRDGCLTCCYCGRRLVEPEPGPLDHLLVQVTAAVDRWYRLLAWCLAPYSWSQLALLLSAALLYVSVLSLPGLLLTWCVPELPPGWVAVGYCAGGTIAAAAERPAWQLSLYAVSVAAVLGLAHAGALPWPVALALACAAALGQAAVNLGQVGRWLFVRWA